MYTKTDMNDNKKCDCETCRIMALMPDQIEPKILSGVMARLMFEYGLRDNKTEIGPVLDDANDMFNMLVRWGNEDDDKKPKTTKTTSGATVTAFGSLDEMLAHIKATEPGVSESTLDELRRLADEDIAKQAATEQPKPSVDEIVALAALLGGPSLVSRMQAYLERKKRAN